jgi:hypothetical protein
VTLDLWRSQDLDSTARDVESLYSSTLVLLQFCEGVFKIYTIIFNLNNFDLNNFAFIPHLKYSKNDIKSVHMITPICNKLHVLLKMY